MNSLSNLAGSSIRSWIGTKKTTDLEEFVRLMKRHSSPGGEVTIIATTLPRQVKSYGEIVLHDCSGIFTAIFRKSSQKIVFTDQYCTRCEPGMFTMGGDDAVERRRLNASYQVYETTKVLKRKLPSSKISFLNSEAGNREYTSEQLAQLLQKAKDYSLRPLYT